MESASVLWFRHGLRLHDNPALHEALINRNTQVFYPVFIFDGETAGTKLVGYNRMKFLLESLQDLDNQFRALGGRLFVFSGSPVNIFKRLHEVVNLKRLCFEQDCEPCWRSRDQKVTSLCDANGIEWQERVSHTLWDPFKIIEANGNLTPLTYESFLYIATYVSDPPKPVEAVDWTGVKFGTIPEHLARELKLFDNIPKPEDFGIYLESGIVPRVVNWTGGETHALRNLETRLEIEGKAFKEGYYLPNQLNPDLLAPPTSQSAALRFGCLSVRKFYWSVHDLYKQVHNDPSCIPSITGQLIWREFFYTMSVNNEYYAEMERNKMCLKVPWYEDREKEFQAWCQGRTGYPFIDAVMRQLLSEGWVHHVGRNAVACFLTRGDLWVSWEKGLEHFLKYLLDADWSVCAGNWMWVSSSAFEKMLDCSECICPVSFGRRFDPQGDYIKRYVPELRQMPTTYLYEPWKAPLEVQEKANCVIGRDYPARIVDHAIASLENYRKMEDLRRVIKEDQFHCRPSNEMELKTFLGLPEECHGQCQ